MVRNLTTTIRSSKKEVSICRDKGTTIIGERINPTGRKALEAELKAGEFDIVRRDAVDQVAAGAAILDINAGIPRTDESSLLVQIIKEVQVATDDVPICIDTTNIKALDVALSYYCQNGAKPLVNSVSAESMRIKEVFPLIKQYGAAVIGLCISDDGIPRNAEGRVENADKIIEEGAKLGIPMGDIIIDPLVLAIGSDWRVGKVILDAIAMIVDKFGVNITMGAGNVSFGMPNRKLLNLVFTMLFIEAGGNAGIVDPVQISVESLGAFDMESEPATLARAVFDGIDMYGAEYIAAFREGRL